MGKAIIIALSIFTLLMILLVLLQPSPQEAAVGNILAAERILDHRKATEITSLDEASKSIEELNLLGDSKSKSDKALAAIAKAKMDIALEEGRLEGSSAEIRTQLEQAKSNLSAPTASERLKGVKDQILAVFWPIVAGVLIFTLLFSKDAQDFLKHLAAVVSNVKAPGGWEIQFAGAVKGGQEEVLRSYRQQVITTYDAASQQSNIADTMSRVVEDLRTGFFAGSLPEKFRCTVHVQDLLFQHSLYQLIDYLPRKSWGAAVSTRGRAWSVRRGLIGLSWRLEENKGEGSVPKDVKQLINDWGMTKEEAEAASGRQTLLCYLVKAKNQSPLAALYFDSEPQDAFGDKDKMKKLEEEIAVAIKKYGLDDALEKVWQKVQASAPLIEIYG